MQLAIKQTNKWLGWAMLLLALSSVAFYIESYTGISFTNTYFWWTAHSGILLFFFFAQKQYVSRSQKMEMSTIRWYLLWNIICIIRGAFVAEIYWDWKGLVGNSMALLLPIVAYAAADKNFLALIFKNYLQRVFILFPLIFLIIISGAYGFYLAPVSLLLFFLPAIPFRWRIVLLVSAGIIMLSDLSARSNVIKFAVPVFMVVLLFKVSKTVSALKLLAKLFFIAPMIFMLMALSGTFNIFQIDQYASSYNVTKQDNQGNAVSEDITADTRTFLYVEVLQTAKKYNTWWFGRTPARGNETNAFYDADVTGRGERLTNEVAILNVFTWTGLVGVFLYFLVFYKASLLAIGYSNNRYSKMLGLFLAFRWMFSWVEDVNNFTLNYMFLWVLIGMCFFKSFREMDDEQVKKWVRSIFKTKSRYPAPGLEMQTA